GGELAEVQRCDDAGHLTADVSPSDQPERTPGESHAHVIKLVVPTPGAHEGVLFLDPMGDRENQRKRRDRDRTTYAIGCNRDHHTGFGARRDVDIVVADPETRHHT